MSKQEEITAVLRRSSRSTRGSIKPVVDLTKSDLSDLDDEPESSKLAEPKKVVKGINDNEDIVELETKSKRSSRPKKGQTAVSLKKKQLSVVDDKLLGQLSSKKGAKQTDGKSKSSMKPSISSAKSNKETIQDASETADDDIEFPYELTEKEMKEVNNAFDINCSNNGEELLGTDDLKTSIRLLGFEPRADELQKLSKKFANKAGKINRDSFHKIMGYKMGSSLVINDNVLNDEISKVFNLLDLDKKGMITLENLKSISKELNEEISDEELHEMIMEADIDGDFQINKQEFYNIMKKTSLY